MFSQEDINFFKAKGISIEKIEEQLEFFRVGFPFLDLKASASIDKGIMEIESRPDYYRKKWEEFRLGGKKKILKFVPASGAASRMFKSLYEFVEAAYDAPSKEDEKSFFENIEKFAFYDDLDNACNRIEGKGIKDLILSGNHKAIINALLQEKGLNYGFLPKGLLKFHRYEGEVRTPVEEHLTEGALYAENHDKTVNIHFTVSKQHESLFRELIADKKEKYEKRLDVEYNIGFSEQKPGTDTVAVDMNNEPFRDANDEIVFRPGGHGALIENLNDLNADIIFIKNIDNVVPDKYKDIQTKYKEILAGVLIDVQEKIFEYLGLIDSGNYSHEQLKDVLYFVQDVLNIKNPDTKYLEDVELVLYLKKKLNRPVRVCGMVKNIGEPGGGPFIAVDKDGTFSPQILESSQIDMKDAAKKAMFEKGTHFNPVDLVCGVKNYRGEKFNLTDYVDKNTGFISVKSKGGKELKALELPGLWNGAMSDWNTVFVEVPIGTFNPVKVVNDLLRKEHQADNYFN